MNSSGSDQQTIALPVILVAASNALVAVVALLRIPLLTKTLGPELFGVWSMISVTISLVVPFCSVVLRTSLIRFLAAETDETRIGEDISSAYVLVLLLGGVVVALALAAAYPVLRFAFAWSSALQLAGLSAVLVVITSLQEIPLGYLRMRQRMGRFAVLLSVQSVLQIGGMAVFLTFGFRLDGVLLGLSFAGMLLILLVALSIFRELGWHRPRLRVMKKYIRWGLPLAPNATITWIIHASDRYILAAIMGAASAGIYTATYQISALATFLLHAIVSVIYPRFIKAHGSGNIEQATYQIEQALRYLLMFSVPAAAGLAVLARPLMSLLTSEAFADGASLIPLIAVGTVFFGVYQVVIYVVHAVDRTHLTMRLLSLAALANIALNLLLIPRLGRLGAGVATVISYSLLAAIAVVVTRKHLRYRIDVAFLWRVLVSSLGMILLLRFVARPELLGVAGAVAVGAASYGILMLILGGFTPDEVRGVAQTLAKLLRGLRK